MAAAKTLYVVALMLSDRDAHWRKVRNLMANRLAVRCGLNGLPASLTMAWEVRYNMVHLIDRHKLTAVARMSLLASPVSPRAALLLAPSARGVRRWRL